MKALFLVFISLFSLNLFSQTIRGKVQDLSATPLEGATIYINEKRQGLITDKNGIFQLHLEEGSYNLTFLLPEHKKVCKKIYVTNSDTLSLEVILEEQSLYTKASLNSTNIRKNILSESKKYLSSPSYYSATSYIRGQLKLNEVADFLDKIRMKVEKKRLSDLKNSVIEQEIYAQIENIATDSCHVTIVEHNGKISKNWSNYGVIEFLSSSLFQNRFNGKISPLNGGSSFYNYIYKGSYLDNKEEIHKIEIKSKIKDSELINGYLYFNDSWDLYSADLKVANRGIDQKVQIIYHEVYEGSRLPITVSTISFLDLLGTKANAKYTASLTYQPQHRSSNLPILSNEKEINTLEEKNLFWESIRTTPLVGDINHVSIPQTEKYKPSNYWLGKVLFGSYMLGNDTSRWNIRYGGVKMIFRDYNYVDGFWLGQRLEIEGNIDKNKKLKITPYLYYLTARHRLAGGSDIALQYDPKRRGTLSLSLGSRSADFNSLSITRYQNYFTSLFFGENGNFFYQKDYATISNILNLNKKLRMSVSLGVEKRSGLSNNTDFTLISRNKIKPNIYPDDRFDQTFYSVGFSYSPSKEYNTSDALEIYKKGISPIFNIEYQEGFSSWQTNNSKYRKLKGGVIYNFPIDYFNEIDLKLEGGVFIDNRNTHFADFQHFGASDMLVNLNSLFDSFLLLENYELQTNRYWFNAFFNYSGKYFLLKRIPFLQGMPFSENVHIKTLFTPDVDLYTELGYSISFTRYIGIGGFVSLNNIQGKKAGIRLSLNLRSLGL
ncbi:DUF5686 family protein [Dysgonomonas sp. Marseille-P4361]|uniref:DUF5686 family protein n=1 Tax=Dysgonomonas sp. Marseille-P4361 TaxID=2161820 RepID=UPI000D55D9AE|nr:DUF5686 family protein [Dysgonomonas sp. Marseille-P4361]